MNPATKAEMLLIENDVQYYCPTSGHYVVEGLIDHLMKVTWYPRSNKLQISRKGEKTKYSTCDTLEETVAEILKLIR